VAELIPAPFPSLLRRMARELRREQKVFDLPARKFWAPAPGLDLGVTFHGRRAGNPLGPAAGPQDQMAQNIVLAWLAGSRILELKTVQINDRLVLPRPCIDAETVGYNVEWSQELRLQDSLREYVAGSMLLDVLRQTDLLGPRDRRADETILDMSVGYGLEGIRSPQVRAWIEGMKDASTVVDGLRATIPDELKVYRDVAFTTRLSDQITLSTFHGCPASEIEGIVRFLLTEMGVHVTVKMNPTLLGKAEVDHLLHDVLGYHEVQTRAEDFEHDLQWSQALEMTDRLDELATSLGRTFQVKFSNTLVVRNHRSFFPASEAVMYLSGAPLHVITLNLVDKWRKARPGIPISFSAGVDNQNFPDCVALGFTPVTTCTDLLRPGGYARLPAYLQRLEERMRALGTGTIPAFVAQSEDTTAIVARVTADPRYRAEKNAVGPRKLGSKLWLLDCVSCDKCVPVCPNDANFIYPSIPTRLEYSDFVVRAARIEPVPGGVFQVTRAKQIGNYQDFCNECGNCDVFCPEDLGPYIEKPRFFGSHEAWVELRGRDGFFLARDDGTDRGLLRHRGREYELRLDRAADRATFTDGVVEVEVAHASRRALGSRLRGPAAEGHRLDFAAYLNLATVMDGVLDLGHSNPVNAAIPDPS
jgi:putative selenate reductase